MKWVHFLGIEGIGMSAVANILLSSGIRVSGSDLNPAEQCERLRQKGAIIYQGHSTSHIHEEVDTVVISEAIRNDNPEWEVARCRNLPIWKYAAMLGKIMSSRIGLAVSGTHGKSTTSGMLAYVLDQAGLSPSFVVGAKVPQLGGNSSLGQGRHLVAEACEYRRSFLNLCPHMAIITNIEADHLDYYRDISDITSAFEDFAGKLPADGLLVIGKLAFQRFNHRPICKTETYSLYEDANWQATDVIRTPNGYSFQVSHNGKALGSFATQLPGIHNVSNALAVIAIAYNLEIPYLILYPAIKSYRGVSRRFDIMLNAPVTIVDDYAHHPTKIKAVLQAARERFEKERIWCVFQPHQASRTYHLLQEFAASFALADEVIVTDIFYARDSAQDKAKVCSEDLVNAINANGKPAHYLGTFAQVTEFLKHRWKKGDVVFTIGAGDIYKLASLLSESGAEELLCSVSSAK